MLTRTDKRDDGTESCQIVDAWTCEKKQRCFPPQSVWKKGQAVHQKGSEDDESALAVLGIVLVCWGVRRCLASCWRNLKRGGGRIG